MGKKDVTELKTRKRNNYFSVEVEVIKPCLGRDGWINVS